jgi:arginyl-tRNA synthetase
MFNIFQYYKNLFWQIINVLAKEYDISLSNDNYEKFIIEPSKEDIHGDFACNIAMVMIKNFNHINNINQPKKLALAIIEKLENTPNFNHNFIKIEVAGAGFINIYASYNLLYQVIIALQPDFYNQNFDFPNLGNGKIINLEYASPNPTGPMHIGHCRGAIYGDVLANLLKKTGYNVLKEYYINDAGSQIDNLLRSVYFRYQQSCNLDPEQNSNLYPGEYLIPIGNKLKDKFSDSLLNLDESQYFSKIRQIVLDDMINLIKEDLNALGIIHDNYFSEYQNLHKNNKIDSAIEKLKQQNLVYYGKLELPKTNKGKGQIDLEDEIEEDKEQLIFRSTNFGDDQDRVIKKEDGSPTYFAADLAYIISKFERGAKIMIMPLGYDHSGYVKRLEAACLALTNNQAKIKVILCQMVKFIKNGEPLKMSKRAGNFITAKEVIEEVGSDVLRFIMLTRKNDAPFDFDLAKVVEQSKDNPIFYVQYAHARCCSVLRNAESEGFDVKNISHININLALLNNKAEIDLIKKIANFVRIIEMSATNFEPHRIAFYLQELASTIHLLWHKGIENPNLKFIIKNNQEISYARLALIMASKKIIATALGIFNINPVLEMR